MTKENKRKNNVRLGSGIVVSGEKAKDIKGTIKRLLSYLKPHHGKLLFIIFLTLMSTAFAIVGPAILGQATNIVVQGVSTGKMDYQALGKILQLLVILFGISFLADTTAGFIMAKVSQKIVYTLRKSINEKIHTLPMGFFDKTPHGEVQSRAINDIETINQALSQSMIQTIYGAAMLLGVLIMMIRINLIMTLIALVVLPLSMVFIRFVVKKSQKHFATQQSALGQVNAHVEEMYTGHMVVKAFNGEKQSLKEFTKMNEDLYSSAWKSQFLSGLMMPITLFMGNLGYVAVCIVGGIFAINGTLSIGNIQAFIQYMRSFNQPVAQVANITNLIQSIAAAAERIFALLDEENEKESVEESTLQEEVQSHTSMDIAFSHLSFGYQPKEPVIRDFSFQGKKGQRVAIVGPTGAGKTTLIKLLLRYYDYDAGAITIDGKPITAFSRSSLRSLFSVVLQDPWVFSGTIEENIRYGCPHATDEQVVEAAKAAHLHHFIQTLPRGYQTPINAEATNISQGQKQLLTIARAFLADHPVLILDEATSSVDTRTERQIQEAMDRLMQGRTSFVIAHRLSTIQDADWILVLQKGNIVEQGTHQSLLKDRGFYASLYQSQFS